jgi:transcription elongation factor GreA
MSNLKATFTKEGFEALNKELRVLVEEKRPKLVERLANARSQGDLSENSDYQNAREELDFLDGKIAELEELIKNARIVDSRTDSTTVDIGNSVKVKINGQETVFSIVGEWEANPAEKKISLSSPLGQALAGKTKGDKVEVEAPAGTMIYEIVDIS